MEGPLTVLNGITRCMAPSGLKKALSFEGCEVGLTGTSATATPQERSFESFVEQNEPKISSKDQNLQRPGDEFLKDFAQDRVQQRLLERSSEPQMVEQSEEVPKMVSKRNPGGGLSSRSSTFSLWCSRSEFLRGSVG